MTFRLQFLSWLLPLVALLPGAPVHALTLHYQAVDLPDTIAGSDLWRYDYQLGGSVGSFESVNLLYSPMSYSDLDLKSALDSSRWSSLVIPPAPAGPADGILSLTAVAPQGASEQTNFALEFIWLGSGTPGAQPFELLDDSFNVIASGSTVPLGTPAIPEPGSLPLLAGALGWLAWQGRRRR